MITGCSLSTWLTATYARQTAACSSKRMKFMKTLLIYDPEIQRKHRGLHHKSRRTSA